MSEDGVTQSKEHENKIAHDNCPEWKEVRGKLITSIAVFIVSAMIFSTSLSDIQGYMEDHNIGFKWIEYIILFSLLIVFYVLPFSVLKIYNRRFPSKISNNSVIYYASGLLFAIICIFIITRIIFLKLEPVQGGERDALWWTVITWLFSIFLINILIDASGFQKVVSKRISCSFKSKTKEVDADEE